MITFEDGGYYQGEWAEDKNGELEMHGWGAVTNESGSVVIQGYFKNGSIHGQCREITEEYYFEGNMNNGKKHGRGILVDE